MQTPIQNNHTAFTLLELLVVVSIMTLLMSVILVTVNSAQAKGRDSKRVQDMVQLRNALELHALSKNGKYPAVPNGASVYFTSMGPVEATPGTKPTCPTTGTDWTSNDTNGYAASFADDMKPYIAQLPKDPKNNKDHCYIYVAKDTSGGSSVGAFYTWPETPVGGFGVGATDPNGYTLGIIGGNQQDYDNSYWEDIDNVIGDGGSGNSGSGYCMSDVLAGPPGVLTTVCAGPTNVCPFFPPTFPVSGGCPASCELLPVGHRLANGACFYIVDHDLCEITSGCNWQSI